MTSAPLEDLVESLPDFGPPPTSQFSGYLDGTAGCDTAANGDFCKIHYWLALAEENPLEKPVVLWLNGGPGSTSILGFVQENGPLLINNDGGLMENPWSWTKIANVFVIESPIGVGYSYCANQLEGKTCQNTDKFTASTSRAALQDFFQKFPEFASNEFFITGESYAGVYIPTLSKEILDNAPEINLVGIAVGDPCTDNNAQMDSMDALWYGHKYGLVDDAVFDLLWNHCDARSSTIEARGGKHLAAAELNDHLLNGVVGLSKEELHDYAHAMHRRLSTDPGPKFKDSPECVLALRKFILSTSSALSQSWKDLYIDDYSLFAPVTNKEDDDMAAYFSRADVRRALNVEETPVESWPYDPKIGFHYQKEYDACNWKTPEGALSMIDFYKNIVPRLRTTFVYNGDTDPCVSYEGTRTAIKRVGFPELDGGSYRPWFYNQTAAPLEFLAEKAPLFGPNLLVQEMGAQFGGEITSYEHGLSFLTFHGTLSPFGLIFSLTAGLVTHSSLLLSYTIGSGHMVSLHLSCYEAVQYGFNFSRCRFTSHRSPNSVRRPHFTCSTSY